MNVDDYFFVLFYDAADTCLAEKSNPPDYEEMLSQRMNRRLLRL